MLLSQFFRDKSFIGIASLTRHHECAKIIVAAVQHLTGPGDALVKV